MAKAEKEVIILVLFLAIRRAWCILVLFIAKAIKVQKMFQPNSDQSEWCWSCVHVTVILSCPLRYIDG